MDTNLNEKQIVWLLGGLGPSNWRYLRESKLEPPVSTAMPHFNKERYHLGPFATSTIAYAETAEGFITRFWWLLTPFNHIDGVGIAAE